MPCSTDSLLILLVSNGTGQKGSIPNHERHEKHEKRSFRVFRVFRGRSSDFGIRVSFGLRPSDFGFRIVTRRPICFTLPMSSRLLWAFLGCFLAQPALAISLLTYNADGDCSCSSNWNISLPLVAAQGREVTFLQPD